MTLFGGRTTSPVNVAKAARIRGKKHLVDHVKFAEGLVVCRCGAELRTPFGNAAVAAAHVAHRKLAGCSSASGGHWFADGAG